MCPAEYVCNPGTNKEKKGRIPDGRLRLFATPLDHAIIISLKEDGFLLFDKIPDNITNETNSPFTTIQLFTEESDATKLPEEYRSLINGLHWMPHGVYLLPDGGCIRPVKQQVSEYFNFFIPEEQKSEDSNPES